MLGIARSVNGLLDRLAEERRTGDARALAAQEAERHRIAQELHDEVGQSLTVVLLGLKQLESQAPAALATEFYEASSASVRRSFAPGLPELTPEAEVVVYRVAQEALTNAARHADARAVELSLQRLGPHVVLEVSDDGRGFTGLTEGSGLMGMRERAALVRAELSVISQPRHGTTVRLTVPVATTGEVVA